jgi:hypothetical protein
MPENLRVLTLAGNLLAFAAHERYIYSRVGFRFSEPR